MTCLNCGKRCRVTFCKKCIADFPNDFPKDKKPQELLAELQRNIKLKERFSCTGKLGKLSIDTLNGIFQIDNIYHSVTEIEKYSFYTDIPKFKGILWRRDVEEKIYFAYSLRNGVRSSAWIDKVICEYRNDGKYVHIEPPLKLFGYRQQFSEMMESGKEDIIRTIANSLERKEGK